MADKLASLALPDGTPTETATTPLPETKAARAARKNKAKPKRDSGDWIIFGCGIGLALICALFPWYIFFNQQEFGIRPLRFASHDQKTDDDPAFQPDLISAYIPTRMIDLPEVDPLPTGAVRDDQAAALSDQPFPGDKIEFRFIHAANGRAMIEDDAGYWIVQRGSVLPNGSRLASIEQRDGSWVLVTAQDAVIPLTIQ